MKNLKTLIPYLRKYWQSLAVGFVFMILQNYGLMKVPGYFQVIVDEIGGKNRLPVIRLYFLKVLVFTLLIVISLFLMRKLIIGASRKIEYQLRQRLFDKLMSVDYIFFQKNETGDLVSRCTNDLDDVRTLLGPGIMYIPNSLSRFLIFLPVLLQLSSTMILILSGLMVFLILLIIVLIPRLRPMYRRIQELAAKISNRAWQVISGISTIKLNSLEGIESKRFVELNQEYIDRNMAVVKLSEGLWPFFIFIFSLTELVILLVGGRQVIAGRMSIGELFQFNMMISSLTFPVLSLGWIMSLLQQGISAVTRINYILDQPVQETQGRQQLTDDKLEFKISNLDYRYPGSEQAVLKEVHLTIKPGQTVGITGMIGSGKSTLLLVMTGLLRPEPGMVFINGHDIRTLEPGSLNQKISVVSQDPFLFSRTLAENIALGLEEAPGMNRIEEAARNASLDRDILAFPDRYQQMVGERGITLSGGQKQRTAIARALCRKTPVLILDDPLSNVDSSTEERILGNLKSMNHSQTLIIVSHRISALKHADLILVMDKGAIVERGTHLSLMKKRGIYSRLALMQQLEVQLERN